MYEYHILNCIQHTRGISFHTPGHKSAPVFSRAFPASFMDVTELSYTDDLAFPHAAIALAQRDIARIVGAKRSYILTDGSTCGVMAMVYTAAKRGKKLIVARNCHKSVWNACTLMGVQPIIVGGVMGDGQFIIPALSEIAAVLRADKEVAGLLVTSPDYYGNMLPLEEYARVLHSYGRLLLVDGAHGGHLAFEDGKAGYAGVFADAWVDGVHKSMPALTQGALLNVKNNEIITWAEEGLQIFRTTSPDFIIMASVEYAVKFCAANNALIKNVKRAAQNAKLRILSLGYGVYNCGDWTKLAVDFSPLRLNAADGARFLEKRRIYAEFNSDRYVLFYLSVNTTAAELDALYIALKEYAACGSRKMQTEDEESVVITVERKVSYLAAVNAPYEWVPLDKAAGRICARNIGVSPPCIPLVTAGEVIPQGAPDKIMRSAAPFGLQDGKVAVLK